MNKIESLKKGVKGKEYNLQRFFGNELPDKRNEWIKNNPDIIIFNTHIIWDGKVFHHIFEYIKN